MPSKPRKDNRKRTRLVVYLNEREMAELVRKAGGRSFSEFARERIFLSDNFHDPLFDVCARLNGYASHVERFRDLLAHWNSQIIRFLVVGQDERELVVDPQFIDDVREALELTRQFAKEAEKATRLIAVKVKQDQVIPKVRRGRPRS